MESNADRVGGGTVGAEVETWKETETAKNKRRGEIVKGRERERARKTVLAGLTSSRWDER